MPKLPAVSGKELVKAFEKEGFMIVRQRGSHIFMQHSDGRVATIPLHKQIRKGTLKKGILNPLHITVEQLIDMLK